MRILLVILAAAPCLLHTATASAQEVGRIPRFQVGGHGTLYWASEVDEYDIQETGFGGGVEAEVRLDLGKALVLLDGTMSWGGDLPYIARAALVFAGGKLGGRTTTSLVYYGGRTVSGNTVTEHYEVYDGKRLPLVYGVMLGASYFDLRGVEEGTEPLVLEAGLAMVGGQAQIMAAPTLTVEGSLGIRWLLQYAFPVGSHPLYFRMSGDHPFAEDGLRTMISFSVGVGASLGVSK